MMPGKNQHTLTVEKLVAGGFGLGRLEEGIIALVRYVLPGEMVLVQEVGRRKDYVFAIPMEILSPSPGRMVPPCPAFGRCGGCDLQHAEPVSQIRLKGEILADSLQRAAGDLFADLQSLMDVPRPSPKQFGYRQRIRLQVGDNGISGFFHAESHILEPVSHCLLAGAELNNVLRQMHDSVFFPGLAQHCNSYELLHNPAEDGVILLLHFRRKPRPTDCSRATELLNSIDGLAGILMQVAGYGLYDPVARIFTAGGPMMSQVLSLAGISAPLTLSWEAGGFCQVNLEQNSNLIQLVLEMVAAGPHRRVLDLYCGYGNFSLPAAKLGAEVIGIDVQNVSIRSARRNASQNKVDNCRFARQQVPDAIASFIAAGETFDTIILDPPRQGAFETVSMLPELAPAQIIYISCNPATLARDLAVLARADYNLSRLVPVDMFPQTHHLESIALLNRTTP